MEMFHLGANKITSKIKLILVKGPHKAQLDLKFARPVKPLCNNLQIIHI